MAEILKVKIEFTEEQKQKIVDECIDILNDRLIEELEKIKAEIRNLFEVEVEETGFVYERVNVYCDDVIEILDKRISELKGKQE